MPLHNRWDNQMVVIHSDEKDGLYFYSELIKNKIKSLHEFLGVDHHLHLFPEATMKPNGMPNGVLICSSLQQTILVPSLLRDPGCGFFIFEVLLQDLKVKQQLIDGLNHFCHHMEQMIPDLNQVSDMHLIYGASCIDTKPSIFSDDCFSIDADALYLDLESRSLSRDLRQITNTLELKTVPKSSNRLIGFIHTGSEYCSRFIINPWLDKIARYSYQTNISSITDLEHDLYGVQATSNLGYEFQQHVKVAMNYCIFKRWWLFEQLKKFLENLYPITLAPINDRCHAGLFEIKTKKETKLIQSRGIQLVNNTNAPYLIAGQRETLAYLIHKKPGENYPDYLSHGTSFAFKDNYNYGELLGSKKTHQYLKNLSYLFANTTLEKEKCLAYHYNINIQKNYLQRYDLSFTPLIPFYNYHGCYLRRITL